MEQMVEVESSHASVSCRMSGKSAAKGIKVSRMKDTVYSIRHLSVSCRMSGKSCREKCKCRCERKCKCFFVCVCVFGSV